MLPPLSAQWESFSELSPAAAEVTPTPMDFGGFEQGPVSRRRVELFLGEVAHLDVLAAPASGVTYFADWSGSKGDKSGGGAFMGVFEMNLLDKSQMNKIFNSRNPVAIIFYNGEREFKKVEGLANTVTRDMLLKGAIGEDPPIETYLANTETCADAMKAFRLRPREAPIAVIHYTQQDQKYVMEEEDLPLSTKSFGRFAKKVRRTSPQVVFAACGLTGRAVQVLRGARGPTDVKAAAAARKAARQQTARDRENEEL